MNGARLCRGRRAAALLLSLLAACGKDGAAAPGAPGGRRALQFPVEVQPVEARAVEYAVSAVGSLEAYEQVQVTARVAGVVDRVHFAEGTAVAAGQTLVEIETDRYRLAVDAAKADLARAQAQLDDAQNGLRRREELAKASPGIVREEELDQFRTKARLAEVDLQRAKVALAQAELNLRDAFVKAPAGGVVQTRTAHTGQYVQAGTPLATMLRRDPLQLRFGVPEAEAGGLRPGMKARFRAGDDARELRATLFHVAEAADPATRMIPVVARVEPADARALRAGGFARVTVPVGGRPDAPVIPQTAVRPAERGFLAFVVEKGVARERRLTLGLRTEDGLVEVRAGLSPGESLVVRGAEALRDGAPVKVAAASSPDAGPREGALPARPGGGARP